MLQHTTENKTSRCTVIFRELYFCLVDKRALESERELIRTLFASTGAIIADVMNLAQLAESTVARVLLSLKISVLSIELLCN